MYLIWTSDLSAYLTDSAASRMVIAIIPAERYIIHPRTGVNLTLQTACLAIAESFNKLSREGVAVKDPSGTRPVSDWYLRKIFPI